MKLIPNIIYIETINSCNANCVMCPHGKLTRPRQILSDEIFLKIIGDIQCAELKGIDIFLHKEGEPLMDNRIADRIAYTKKFAGRNNKIGLNTNAMLLTPDLSEELIDAGLDVIYFSVDGINKESYDRYRKNLDYETVVKNIQAFFRIRDSLQSSIEVIMQMLITDRDNNDSEAFKMIWSGYDCQFFFKLMHSYLDGGCSSLTNQLSASQLRSCEDPNHILVVYSNGEVGLCCWDYNNEYSIGNVMQENLFSIFNNAKAHAMREHQKHFNCYEIIPCSRCHRIFGNDDITGLNWKRQYAG